MKQYRLHRLVYTFFFLFLLMGNLSAQENTIGLIHSEIGNQDGYVLFAPLYSKTTYLIDKQGKQVHSWESQYYPKYSAFLLEDGTLLRTGGLDNPYFNNAPAAGGIIEKIAWDGRVIWSFRISDSTQCQHHDIALMPNGHILANVWEAINSKLAIEICGRDSDKVGSVVWSEKIVEIDPVENKIVWQWRLWDHVSQNKNVEFSNPYVGSIAENPGRLNINYVKTSDPKNPSWIHMNGIDYNPQLDQIMVSAHALGEIWIIDHSTTTKQASQSFGGKYGKGGDFLYRWGNPAAYERGTEADRVIFGQHNPNWIRPGLPNAGKILLFNNGVGRPEGEFSSIEILEPPVDSQGNYILDVKKPYGPDKVFWHYTDPIPTDLYTTNQSGVQQLPNGNINVCVGTKGTFFEVTPDKRVVWKYINPVVKDGIAVPGDKVDTGTGLNNVFRTYLYLRDYPGLQNKVLAIGYPIELSLVGVDTSKIIAYPNPPTEQIRFTLKNTANQPTTVSISNSTGKIVLEEVVTSNGDQYSMNIGSLDPGMYVLKVVDGSEIRVGKIMIIR